MTSPQDRSPVALVVGSGSIIDHGLAPAGWSGALPAVTFSRGIEDPAAWMTPEQAAAELERIEEIAVAYRLTAAQQQWLGGRAAALRARTH